MKYKLEDYLPVGANWRQELKWVAVCLMGSLLFSFTYLLRLYEHYNRLFDTVGQMRFLREGAVMPDFAVLLGRSLGGFALSVLCAGVLLAYHYAYHFQGSKSIYLMRRLPQRGELLRRCCALPAASALLAVFTAMAVLLLYFRLYHFITPQDCLVPGQWDILLDYYF